MKYRKKPLVIEAEHFVEENKDRAFNFITCNCVAVFNSDGNPAIKIQTPNGVLVADLGDWIIKGIGGEFYPCKPDIFEATFDTLRPEGSEIL